MQTTQYEYPQIEAAAAIGIANGGSLMRLAAVMPIKADKVFSAITAHG
jgi:hypothetical protein